MKFVVNLYFVEQWFLFRCYATLLKRKFNNSFVNFIEYWNSITFWIAQVRKPFIVYWIIYSSVFFFLLMQSKKNYWSFSQFTVHFLWFSMNSSSLAVFTGFQDFDYTKTSTNIGWYINWTQEDINFIRIFKFGPHVFFHLKNIFQFSFVFRFRSESLTSVMFILQYFYWAAYFHNDFTYWKNLK